MTKKTIAASFSLSLAIVLTVARLVYAGWTDPAGHVWATGETVTASNMNTYIANNLSYLKGDAGVITLSSALNVTTVNASSDLQINSASVTNSPMADSTNGYVLTTSSAQITDLNISLTRNGVWLVIGTIHIDVDAGDEGMSILSRITTDGTISWGQVSEASGAMFGAQYDNATIPVLSYVTVSSQPDDLSIFVQKLAGTGSSTADAYLAATWVASSL